MVTSRLNASDLAPSEEFVTEERTKFVFISSSTTQTQNKLPQYYNTFPEYAHVNEAQARSDDLPFLPSGRPP